MRILYVTTISSTINAFLKPHIQMLVSKGYEVDIATNGIENLDSELGTIIKNTYDVSFNRKPLTKENFRAYKEIKNILKKNNYDVIHVHTPIASTILRIALQKNSNTKLIYTAHGFHFFEGAPRKNWLLFYPIEKILSYFTDILITINNEDYQRAKKKFHAKKTVYIPGIGIDTGKFSQNNYQTTKIVKDLDLSNNDFILISVGEINKNKNHEIVIRAIAEINNPSIKYVIVGKGPEQQRLKLLSKELKVNENILFLGYKNNVKYYLNIADAFAFPSKREGLGLAALEAMACGLPIVTSDIHGIRDYSENGVTGFTFNPNELQSVINAINNIYKLDENQKSIMKIRNKEIAKKFDISIVMQIMEEIYEYDN